MDDTADPLMRLQDLLDFLAAGMLDENVQEQAALTARLLAASSCSIMLLGDDKTLRMRVHGCHGNLPDAALQATVGYGEGIAGRVLESGKALLVPDIGMSVLAPLGRRGGDAGPGLVCAPLRIDGKLAGVVNVASAAGRTFDATDLQMLEVIALFIGKSIQVQQLRRLLDSRFAQLAMQQEVEGPTRTVYRNPDEVARILAKTFYKEMAKAGFTAAQIVNASSEIIEQLHQHLHKGS